MVSATGLRRTAAASAILLLAAALQMASPFAADPAAASTVTPAVIEGNPTCADFATDATMLKIENGSELRSGDGGTYSAGDLSVTVGIYSTEMGWAFDWTANRSIDVVVAKGGPMANVYTYGGSTGDTDLHAPLNVNSELWYGLSHVSFCAGATTPTQPTTPTSPPTQPTQPTQPTTPHTSPTSAILGAIGDYVWLDVDKDGAQGLPAIETPVAGATVQLLAADGTLIAAQVTGPDGLYLFDDLPAGNYRVQVVYRGATYTIARAPGVPMAANSDVDPLGNGVGRTGLIGLSAGEIDLTWDAGIVVDVLGIQIESTTTVTVEPVTLDTLPFTGSDQGGIVLLGSALALAGVVTLLAVRQRPTEHRSGDVMAGWSDR